MINCPYNNSCIKSICDLSCSDYSEIEHWMNRCELKLSNPAIRLGLDKISEVEELISNAELDVGETSNYIHLSVHSSPNPQLMADLTSYILICKYCRKNGFYNGVYKLNFAQYLDELKKSWNSRYNDGHLDDIQIWINSAKYLIICNLGLVRFGDFESQTLLSILQERYDYNKYNFIFLEKGKYSLPGKSDSLFYAKLKKEIMSRGVKI